MSRMPHRRGDERDRPMRRRRAASWCACVPAYLPDQSDPDEGRYVWAYTVEIENHGDETVQLISRRWIITDAPNRVEEVAGPGVVGEQPVLSPARRSATPPAAR